jgi:hypothetical protein
LALRRAAGDARQRQRRAVGAPERRAGHPDERAGHHPGRRPPLLTAFIGAIPGQSCPLTLDVDDFYIADTSGSINNTFLGDVRVDTLKAQADGSLNQWTVAPSGTAAWEAVSDEDETTSINASSIGLRQSFDVAPLPVMATPAIFGVQLSMLARKTDAGLGKVKGLVVSGAQTAVSTEVTPEERPIASIPLLDSAALAHRALIT